LEDYIDDDDEVLEQYGLDEIKSRRSRGVQFGENLIDPPESKSALYKAAGKLMADDALIPELDRIYRGRTGKKAFGHPVHYFVETDSADVRRELPRVLLSALYANGRLAGRRYCFTDVKAGSNFSFSVFESLYKSCREGAIVIRFDPSDDSAADDDYINGELENISFLCEMAKKYRDRVLTVFCLPRVCEKSKKIFCDNLGTMTMVTLKEDMANAEKSRECLKSLCREHGIRADKRLLGRIVDDKTYYPDELRGFFTEWYDKKLKTEVYPQYGEIASTRSEAAKEAPRGTAFDELNGMIGLAEAKKVIGNALNYYKMQRIYKDKGIKQDRPAMHMVFTGNPGTAKTTVARLFARIMKENGLLSTGHLVEVGRGDLVGKYVGWTAQTVIEKFKSAMGGVLFIDEAYSLVDDRGGSFGDEAINTIVQEMENRREDLVVIFAGYPAEMETFLQKNPGLRSRIAFHVPFADYSASELCDIARMIGKGKGVTFTDSAIEKMKDAFAAASARRDFGNGRYVRNVIELSRMNQASRIMSMDPEKVTAHVLSTIEDSDLFFPEAPAPEKTRRVGFTV